MTMPREWLSPTSSKVVTQSGCETMFLVVIAVLVCSIIIMMIRFLIVRRKGTTIVRRRRRGNGTGMSSWRMMIGGGIPQYTGISTHTTTNHRVAGHLTGRHHDGEYRCGDGVVTVVFVNGGGGGGALLLLLVLVRRLHHGGYLSSSSGSSVAFGTNVVRAGKVWRISLSLAVCLIRKCSTNQFNRLVVA